MTLAASANNEFIGASIEFDEIIANLQALRARHFGVNPDTQRHWGDVGSIRHVNELLREALDHYGA